jgi:predicted nucleotide-binding protein (sugar kinase/HSP70/actin superfamily)
MHQFDWSSLEYAEWTDDEDSSVRYYGTRELENKTGVLRVINGEKLIEGTYYHNNSVGLVREITGNFSDWTNNVTVMYI